MAATFCLDIYDSRCLTRVTDVCHFVGDDASGRFGLMAHHDHFMTALDMGLARFQAIDGNGEWEYLAFPGALLSFENNHLTLVTRRFWRNKDFDQINRILNEDLLREQQASLQLRQSLARIEENMLKRLWELKKQQA